MEEKIEVQQNDKEEIIRSYRALLRVLPDYVTKAEKKEIRKAFDYAMNAHEGARRKSGEPYILHPLAVARIAAREVGLDATSVICALLHDVVEDTFATVEDIKIEFGSQVAVIIDGLTKISGVFDHKSSAQAENFRKMLLTLSDDIRVILVKLADRLHNMRTLQYMKKESQLKIASETLYLYAPLANRLGLNAIKTELEELAFKYTEPNIYIELNAKLKKFQRESKYYIKSFIRSIREQMIDTNLEFEIKSRWKSIYSIYNKMNRQGIPFEEVYDLFAIRIILDSPLPKEKADCWQVYTIVTELYKPNPERIRDWITLPKSNGYESLHVTVMGPRGRWVEVQIRTSRMNYIAEKGFAAHWKYKNNSRSSAFDTNFERWLDQVREILEDTSTNAVDVIKEFKTNLVADEVFVFTPKGDLKKLPQNSTVVDFAYEIHTNIGDTVIGAKVNNKVVPLSYELKNGDQVEIITSKKQSPKEDWLSYANTSKAIHSIKQAVKRERRRIAERGKDIFEWRAAKFGVDEHSMVMKELLAYFNLESKLELYYLIGAHRIDLEKVQKFIEFKKQGGMIELEEEEKVRDRIESKKDFEEMLKSKGMDTDALIVGKDMRITDYKFAPCCQPIPGDDILGFFDPDEGVVIHRPNCQTAIGLMSNFGKNILKTKWTEMHDITFLAGIEISGEDRQGMMNDIIKVISIQLRLNMRSITIDSEDGMFKGLFKVFVRNTEELDRLKSRLLKVQGVLTVTRVEKHL